MKMLHEDTSSRFFLFTESRYKTSENPLFLALLIAFRTYIYKSLVKLQRNLKKKKKGSQLAANKTSQFIKRKTGSIEVKLN